MLLFNSKEINCIASNDLNQRYNKGHFELDSGTIIHYMHEPHVKLNHFSKLKHLNKQ